MILFRSKYFSFSNQKYTYSVINTILKRNVAQEKKINNAVDNEILEKYGYGYANKMIYNSVVEELKEESGYSNYFSHYVKKLLYKKKLESILQTTQPLPLTLKYYLSEDKQTDDTHSSDVHKNNHHNNHSERESDFEDNGSNNYTNFPLNITHPITQELNEEKHEVKNCLSRSTEVDMEIQKKYDLLKKSNNWMASYDNYEHDLGDYEEDESIVEDWSINYGTSDPSCRISNTPCGGCGALLHCKNPSIPGYIPSEIFKNYKKAGGAALEAIICQRCYFLKEHNVALQVQVSPEDYPKVLMTIKNKKALVLVMVDLTDFPCSLWPGIADILESHNPIIIVGNKVDLLPKDDENFLNNIKKNLIKNVRLFGFGSKKILDVTLVSAKTEYGIENLISIIFSKWKYAGDVYLVGCTNVGKSTLFNALMRSDLCKSQARDLLQRATTSVWPGTTLNLLKFPILKPSKYRMFLRSERMQQERKIAELQEELRKNEAKATNSIESVTLMGHIGRTFGKKVVLNEEGDSFAMPAKDAGRTSMGVDEKDPEYAQSKWCYDTPGVVQPDQILNILTADELMYVIPREIIRPETFIMKPGMTLFIAGLARLDYLEGTYQVRFTVFRSKELPITVCYTEHAETLYQDLLGTAYFKVPINDGDRLSKWPGLESNETFEVNGQGWDVSSLDVVLSNAGWVALHCGAGKTYKFQAWTPEKRGIYIRECLLPKAVKLRGSKIRNSAAYKEHRLIA